MFLRCLQLGKCFFGKSAFSKKNMRPWFFPGPGLQAISNSVGDCSTVDRWRNSARMRRTLSVCQRPLDLVHVFL